MEQIETSYRIRKEQKESLIKLVSKIAGEKPFLIHIKEESKTEITITIISSSFTSSQTKELHDLKDDQVMTQKIKAAGFEINQVSFNFSSKK